MSEDGVGPKVYDAWLCYLDGVLHLYLAQERLYGSTLYQWYITKYAPTFEDYERKGPYPELCQLLRRQVETMHRLGVVHNDLHPNNIYLMENLLAIKILDFGLSQTWPDIWRQVNEDDKAFHQFAQDHGYTIPPTSKEALEREAQAIWQKKGNDDYKYIIGPDSYGLCNRIDQYHYVWGGTSDVG